jgi:hypothetical protein
MGRRMATPSPSAAGGGVFLALGILLGTIGGLVFGEPSRGFLFGLAAGVVAAVAVWLRGR